MVGRGTNSSRSNQHKGEPGDEGGAGKNAQGIEHLGKRRMYEKTESSLFTTVERTIGSHMIVTVDSRALTCIRGSGLIVLEVAEDF